MAIPTEVAAYFIVVEPKVFGGFQVFFDAPAGTDGLYHDGQGRVGWGKDQVIGQLGRVVQAATKDEPMATVHHAPVDHRQAGPVKEALAFGAQALTQALPVLGAEDTVRDAGHISQQEADACLPSSDFGGRHRQRVGVALLLEPVPQVGAVA